VITRADADKLRAYRATQSAVLSVYLPVPVDVAEHRSLPTRARDLLKRAAGGPRPGGGQVSEADLDWIIGALTERSHEWLGHTAALFACAEIGLAEALAIRGSRTGQAVVANRPHIRPLLAAHQRNPPYRAALLDKKHAWILHVTDDQIETVAERTDRGVRSTAFAGWYGLEAYRIQQRIMELSRQHYRDTIAILERSADSADRPLVLGGHENEISQFLAALPRSVRQNVAGSFSVDLQTATPGRVRELAGPVITRWTRNTEARLVAEVLSEPPDVTVTTDLDGCLAASRARAVAHLILADERLVPGFACADCEALSRTADDCDCQDPAGACAAVPDLLDELATRTLDGGGQVTAVRNPPFPAAARLRFPVPARRSRLP
jgi:hypothetical protein